METNQASDAMTAWNKSPLCFTTLLFSPFLHHLELISAPLKRAREIALETEVLCSSTGDVILILQ